jgi:predicted nucleic acid-binding protein
VVRTLIDTNVLVDYLNAVPEARAELQRYPQKAISIVTWMEVMVGAGNEVESATRAFLKGFDVVPLDETIAERAVDLRHNHRIKLRDAIIWATAQTKSLLLVTRNTKDFAADDPSVRLPYKL